MASLASELALTREENDYIAAVIAFGKTSVAPFAATWEHQRRQPLETMRAAARMGLTRYQAPREKGGFGFSFSAKAAILEALARFHMPFSFCITNTHNAAAKLAREGKPEHLARYLDPLYSGELIGCTALSEPGAGSDFAAITTRAEKVADGWRLDGEKGWIANAANAGLIFTYAQTDPAKGWRGIACFLVDASRPGFERRPPYQLAGGHVIGAGGFRLSDYRAEQIDLISPPGEAFKAALGSINGARTYVAAMCCGMLAEALRLALAYGRQRHSFGKPLLEHQGLRWKLADVATDLEAARALTARAARAIDAGADAILPAAMAKKFAGEMILGRLGDCMQAMGANGLREEYGIGLHLAAARICNYVDGSTEIQNERIGALLEQAFARG
jgi:alkylation response protein AidB-like acyl-CoA dehydrogenase